MFKEKNPQLGADARRWFRSSASYTCLETDNVYKITYCKAEKSTTDEIFMVFLSEPGTGETERVPLETRATEKGGCAELLV